MIYPGEDFNDAADRLYAEEVQRRIDDKSAASGLSPEQLSIQDAYAEGARAGARGVALSLNPYQDNSPEHDAWSRGRLAGIGRDLSRRSA